MAKPILVINYCIDGMSMSMAVKNLHELQKVVSESNANDEYFTFLLPVRSDSNIQVFYDKDLNDIKYEELKQMIETKMKSFEEKSVIQQAVEEVMWEEDLTRWQKIKYFFKDLFNRE